MDDLKKQIDIRLQLGDVFRRYIEKHKINPLPWGESVDEIRALLSTEKCIASEVEECPWGRDNVEFRQKWLDIHKGYQEKSRQLINHWQTRALTAEGINEKLSLDGWWVEVEYRLNYQTMPYKTETIPLTQAIAEKRDGRLMKR